jgi:hypothetical protein
MRNCARYIFWQNNGVLINVTVLINENFVGFFWEAINLIVIFDTNYPLLYNVSWEDKTFNDVTNPSTSSCKALYSFIKAVEFFYFNRTLESAAIKETSKLKVSCVHYSLSSSSWFSLPCQIVSIVYFRL